MYELRLNRPMALGNGTRDQRDLLATIDGITPNELQAEAYDLAENDLSQLPGTITPGEGIEPIEVLTALRNPRLCEFVEVAPKRRVKTAETEESAPDDASVDSTAAPKPAPAKKTRSRRTKKSEK